MDIFMNTYTYLQGCRLETFFAGKWGTVCDRGFDKDNAGILCKALGFSEAQGKVTMHYTGGTTAVSTGACVCLCLCMCVYVCVYIRHTYT